MSAGRSTWLGLAALLGAGCGAERDGGALDIGSGEPLHDMQFSVESLRKLAAASEEVSA